MKRRICNILGFAVLSSALSLTACTTNVEVKSFEVSEAITNANAFINQNIASVTKDLKNSYHLNPPVGWINDPNGFSEFQDKFHLFYQYNPYEAVWGPMHWGHQTTKDFIKWEYEDVALAPDMDYDSNGCFSGTALVEDGVQYLAYTAVTDVQNQGLAYSYDGKTYKKLDELLLSGKDLPKGFSNTDFRDPKLFKRDGKFYILVGNKDNQTGAKQIIMFVSEDITGPYTYAGVVYKRTDLGGILECPDLITIDETDVLIASPQSIRDEREYVFQNADSCIYVLGNLSVHSNKFYQTPQTEAEEFDKGFSFYAPQTVKTKDGRCILTAWMRSWSEPNLTKEDGWCGAMVLPRELTIKDNHIYQAPVREIKNYFKNEVQHEDVNLENQIQMLDTFSSRTARITMDIDISSIGSTGKAGIEVFKGTQYYTRIGYDAGRGYVYFDRVHCGSMMDGVRYAKVDPIDGKIGFEIFLDNTSVEIFINGGYYTMTGTTFTPLGNDGIALFAEKCSAHFSNLTKTEIVV